MFFSSFSVVEFKAHKIDVVKVDGKIVSRNVTHFTGGYHIVSSVTDSPSDGMYDAIRHTAVFDSKEKAEAFMQKVSKSRLKINLQNWQITDHPCAAYQRKQEDNPLMFCPI